MNVESTVLLTEKVEIILEIDGDDKSVHCEKKVAHSVKKRAFQSEDTEAKVEGKKPRRLKPLQVSEEAWTKVEVSLNWFQKMTYNNVLFPPLSLFIKPKVKEESWKLIRDLDLSELKTVGDIEKIAVRILDQEMTDCQKKKEEIHGKLKDSLKTYAKEGIMDAIPSLLQLMQTR